MIHDSGINCRLPHTPRTPTSGVSHYFDEILSKVARPKQYRSRRGSTRSIAGRSDISSDVNEEDEEVEKQKRIDDTHVLDYVASQLQRVKSHDTSFDPNKPDEFEAQADTPPATFNKANGLK